MFVSFVLRLVPEELATGELVGQVEDVASGRVGLFRGGTDLTAFCAAVVTTPPQLRTERTD